MRSVVVTASLLTILWLGLPVVAAAQEPEPAPAPEAPAPPPPPRDVAVPRAERTPTREPAARVRETSDESRPPAGATGRVREPQHPATDDGGSRRQPSAAAADRRRPVETTSATAAAADEQRSGAQRRGAARRPASGGSSTADESGARGRAVPRSSVPPRDDRPVFAYPNYRYYNRYYDPWGYGGFGLGYFYYAPWVWNSGYYGNGGYAGGYGGQYSAYGYDLGSVKLKVKPRDAEVFVDNYFAGYVDDFDGLWQALKLDRGGYRIELRKPGYQPLRFDVRVQPDRTITLRGEMKPLP